MRKTDLLTPVDCISSIQWRSWMAGFCSSVIALNDVSKFRNSLSTCWYGSQCCMGFPKARISLLYFLHSCSISSTSNLFQAVRFQSFTHEFMTYTKSHSFWVKKKLKNGTKSIRIAKKESNDFKVEPTNSIFYLNESNFLAAQLQLMSRRRCTQSK